MFIPPLRWVFHLFLILPLASCASSGTSDEPQGPPQTIISVVPSATEMLYAFGLGDRVIAVGDYDQFPPEVATKPRIGGLINPNIEKIIEMRPGLVITYGSQEVLKRRLESIGISLFPFVHGNVEHTLHFMEDLGRAVAAEERAKQLVSEIRATFHDIRKKARPHRPKVLLIHSRGAGALGSFYSVGSKAFQHDLIEIAGGRNLFEDVPKETIEPTLEEVLSRMPDIIVESLPPPSDSSENAQRRKDWAGLGLAKGGIYIENEMYFLVPGPRLALAARRLAQIINETRCTTKTLTTLRC